MSGTRPLSNTTMLQAVAAVSEERGARCWLVGGSVRDRELRRFSPDLDVAVTGDARIIAQETARALGLPWFVLSHEHEAYRVVGSEAHVDVAVVRGGGIVADLAQRDFTINAMALPLEGGAVSDRLVDPFGGLDDLRARRLRAVSRRVFAHDPLRLMRAARFIHVMGLAPAPGLEQAVRSQAGAIERTAQERVTAEMVLTFDAGRAGEAVRLWSRLGLLQVIAPEIGEADHQGGLAAPLDRLEVLLTDPVGSFAEAGALLLGRLAKPVDGTIGRRTALRFAALLGRTAPGRAAQAARRLRLSSPMEHLLGAVARVGLEGPLPEAKTSSAGPGRDAVLFLWEAAPWEPEVLLLSTAVRASCADHDPRAACLEVGSLMQTWARRETEGVPRLPFDGNELMRALGIGAGPLLGRALRAARLAWEAGEVSTTAQALAAARAALGRPQPAR